MDRTVTLDYYGNDITCMKTFDALKYPCYICDNEDCPNREVYEDIEEWFDMEVHMREKFGNKVYESEQII